MNVLNGGGGAVDAVEVAIRVLEDMEITNAGYGSNLSMDGTVECDATIVDHYGRSGAVGAVGQVQHPIHLARLILDYSTRPLSLRRVPPNLLAGPGATAFAASLQVPIVPHNRLVSNAARDRWIKWARDLKAAESRSIESAQGPEWSEPQTGPPQDHQMIEPSHKRSTHSCEGQLHAPEQLTSGMTQVGSPRAGSPLSVDHAATPPVKRMGMDAATTPTPPHVTWAGQRSGNDGEAGRTLASDDGEVFVDENPPISRPIPTVHHIPSGTSIDTVAEETFTLAAIPTPVLENTDLLLHDVPLPPLNAVDTGKEVEGTESVSLVDDITDTVGAIAVDSLGNLAAGSSSGGIGMKHRGRIGPAALVGIGTAVIPVDADDTEKTSVATVTSGTGEHMATTMAAGHPSVKNSNSAGGIGVLGVKKTTDGVWLYFAHNTDSFAMASMSSEESKPRSVMSRGKDNDKVVSGGRPIKYHRVSSWPPGHHSTWPPNAEASPPPEQPTKRQKRMRVTPTGLHPDSDSDSQSSNDSYKAAYEEKMRQVHDARTLLAEKMAMLT
ncbi:MAG: hypothetical protein Q9179_005306 [Wetmoreana sp. 5 TL-2023]